MSLLSDGVLDGKVLTAEEFIAVLEKGPIERKKEEPED